MNKYQSVTPDIIRALEAIIDRDNVWTSKVLCAPYAQDKTEHLVFMPEVVVRPNSTEHVSNIMKICNANNIPVTVRGGGSGLAGGALPVCGGVLMSMERFDKILCIDADNFQAIVEPGVVTETLQNILKTQGLFYPPDPLSRGWSHIGGNVSTNAGGTKAVKYGVVRDYVLNLEVVLPDGTILWTGANTLKNSTCYNLTQLLVGSEGTLAVITQIVLKLLPHPTHSLLLLVPFSDPQKACSAVAAIFRAGITPSVLEFMERDVLFFTMKYIQESPLHIPEHIQAHLLVEVDGFEPDLLHAHCEKIATVAQAYDCDEILFADDDATKNILWKLRRNMGRAIKSSIYKELDTVVPRASLPALLLHTKQIAKAYALQVFCFGHAGDGNLHINFVKGATSDEIWNQNLPIAIRAIFHFVKQLGGTLSGEHGIGWIQKPYLDIVFSEAHINLLSHIKKAFDPNHILNPQKIFSL